MRAAKFGGVPDRGRPFEDVSLYALNLQAANEGTPSSIAGQRS